ncbi:MAG: Sec-independent protein translocase protein TatB [Rhodospirillales bacterium]
MFDIGWSELVVIGVVAIIAIGPKDLPLALKTVGQWVAKARALAREFQGSLDEMIREAELDKVKQEVQSAASSFDVTKEIEASKAEVEKALEMPSIEMDPLSPPPAEPPPEASPALKPDGVAAEAAPPAPGAEAEVKPADPAPPAAEPQPAEPPPAKTAAG